MKCYLYEMFRDVVRLIPDSEGYGRSEFLRWEVSGFNSWSGCSIMWRSGKVM